jgi:CubicO group peptidase (beta-lactamase class C family)
VQWPTRAWPQAEPPPGVGATLDALLDEVCDHDGPLATTHAVVVVHGGAIVAERYQGELAHFDRPPDPLTSETRLLSWSMAKSMLHAVVGLLVGDRLLDLHAPAGVAEWADPDDPRHGITLHQMLGMRAGVVGHGEAYQEYLRARLFAPIGMHSAAPELDPTGTWVASSYVRATARDFARFGLLCLRDGTWDGTRLLPAGWVDYGRTVQSVDPEDGPYGAHWWGVAGDTLGTFRASGYEGQSITVCPAHDLVVVRLGKTAAAHSPDLTRWRADMVRAFGP